MPSSDFYNADKTFKSPDEIRRQLTCQGIRPDQMVHSHWPAADQGAHRGGCAPHREKHRKEHHRAGGDLVTRSHAPAWCSATPPSPAEAAVNYCLFKLMGWPDVKVWVN